MSSLIVACADNVAETISGEAAERLPGEDGKQRTIAEEGNKKVNDERTADEEGECHRWES